MSDSWIGGSGSSRNRFYFLIILIYASFPVPPFFSSFYSKFFDRSNLKNFFSYRSYETVVNFFFQFPISFGFNFFFLLNFDSIQLLCVCNFRFVRSRKKFLKKKNFVFFPFSLSRKDKNKKKTRAGKKSNFHWFQW